MQKNIMRMSINNRYFGLPGILLSLCSFNVAAINIVEAERLIAMDPAQGDNFGWAVDVDGDTAVISSLFDDDSVNQSGSVYVYEKQLGSWTEVIKLHDPSPASNERFGEAVAIQGDTIVVGEPSDDINAGSSFHGAAWVFSRTAGVWGTTPVELLPNDPANIEYQGYGASVAIDNGTIVVGVRLDSSPGTASGSAYIFELNMAGTAWVNTAKFVSPLGTSNHYFGASVAIDGDTIIVGAPTSGSGVGTAHAFTRSSGTWNTTAIPLVALSAAGDEYGNAVAISGNIAVVAARSDDTTNGIDSGSFSIFDKSSGSWTFVANCLAAAAAGTENDNFGWSIDIEGNTVVVGAFRASSFGRGAFYVFSNPASGCNEDSSLAPANGIPVVNTVAAGRSVALNGGTLFVTASSSDVTTDGQQTIDFGAGAAFVYDVGDLIPVSGGTVTADGGDLVIDFPSGALTEDTIITTAALNSSDVVLLQGGASGNFVKGYSFEPDGTEFNSGFEPTITMTVDVTGFSQAERDALDVYFFNTGTSLFEPLGVTPTQGATVNELIFSFTVEHFSSYAIVEEIIVIEDADLDGVADSDDNCTLVPNNDQRDTNGDGYGNICDADLNNDGLVTVTDFLILRGVLNTADQDADLNGDGLVTVTDFLILRGKLNQPPGPSGVAP